jgi:uncharacterized protein YukJ
VIRVALRSYGVLKGRVVEGRPERGADSQHHQVRMRAANVDFRITVDVLSRLPPSELLFLAAETFEHPVTAGLPALAEGFHAIQRKRGGIALDYVRGNLFDRTALRPVPATAPGPGNDLADIIDRYVTRATADPEARLYAFGERWGPESTKPDKVFGFLPGNGIHDVHMNQGNAGRFVADDGVWQDGGLLFHFPGQAQWVAIFLAFPSQSFHTDDVAGQALPALGVQEPEVYHSVRIIAALVNGTGPAPEGETVTLLNARNVRVDLAGWSIADRTKARMPLQGVLDAGEARRVPIRPPIALGNSGGLITLLDPSGLQVDGVAYTKEDARREGWTVVF